MVVLYAPWCQFCQGLEATYAEVAEDATSDTLRVAKYQADVDKEYAQSIGLTTYPTILFMPAGSDKIVKYTSDRRTVESLQMWSNALSQRS
jgi:adenylyl-sulfate reductase (glutathione)